MLSCITAAAAGVMQQPLSHLHPNGAFQFPLTALIHPRLRNGSSRLVPREIWREDADDEVFGMYVLYRREYVTGGRIKCVSENDILPFCGIVPFQAKQYIVVRASHHKYYTHDLKGPSDTYFQLTAQGMNSRAQYTN